LGVIGRSPSGKDDCGVDAGFRCGATAARGLVVDVGLDVGRGGAGGVVLATAFFDAATFFVATVFVATVFFAVVFFAVAFLLGAFFVAVFLVPALRVLAFLVTVLSSSAIVNLSSFGLWIALFRLAAAKRFGENRQSVGVWSQIPEVIPNGSAFGPHRPEGQDGQRRLQLRIWIRYLQNRGSRRRLGAAYDTRFPLRIKAGYQVSAILS